MARPGHVAVARQGRAPRPRRQRSQRAQQFVDALARTDPAQKQDVDGRPRRPRGQTRGRRDRVGQDIETRGGRPLGHPVAPDGAEHHHARRALEHSGDRGAKPRTGRVEIAGEARAVQMHDIAQPDTPRRRSDGELTQRAAVRGQIDVQQIGPSPPRACRHPRQRRREIGGGERQRSRAPARAKIDREPFARKFRRTGPQGVHHAVDATGPARAQRRHRENPSQRQTSLPEPLPLSIYLQSGDNGK